METTQLLDMAERLVLVCRTVREVQGGHLRPKPRVGEKSPGKNWGGSRPCVSLVAP